MTPDGGARLETLDRETIAEKTTNRLRQLIFEGILSAGTLLYQDELAKALGVSRTPLRQALSSLAAEGLVTMEPHRPAQVFQPTIEELQQIYEVRALLEAAAIAKACETIDRQALSRLQSLIRRMDVAEVLSEYYRLNLEFHDECYASCGNRHLLRQIGSVRGTSAPYAELFLMEDDHRSDAQVQHRAILKALRQRDVPQAQELIKQHLLLTVESVAKHPVMNGQSGVKTADTDGSETVR